VPVYYLHVRQTDGSLAEDLEGFDFADLDAAEAEATASAREIAAREIREGGRSECRSIEVTDAGGTLRATVSFRDATES
jgi:hypothetical protein